MEVAPNLFSRLFPSRCHLCHRAVSLCTDYPSVEICTDCHRRLPYNDVSCRRCALPLAEETGDTVLCGGCIKKAPAFDYACSLFRYEDDIIRLVHQLKFAQKIGIARSLGEMLLLWLQVKMPALEEQPDCLLPVPLHSARWRQRGFNQSVEIARVIARKLAIPIEQNAVIRQRKTISQTGLNAPQRQKNIRGAFYVASEIKAKHILIIDDVMTTGSTVNELARVLKKNGVVRVGVLSVARAPLKN